MQFLSLYTPAVQSSGPPSPEHMAQMGKLMEGHDQQGRARHDRRHPVPPDGHEGGSPGTAR